MRSMVSKHTILGAYSQRETALSWKKNAPGQGLPVWAGICPILFQISGFLHVPGPMFQMQKTYDQKDSPGDQGNKERSV